MQSRERDLYPYACLSLSSFLLIFQSSSYCLLHVTSIISCALRLSTAAPAHNSAHTSERRSRSLQRGAAHRLARRRRWFLTPQGDACRERRKSASAGKSCIIPIKRVKLGSCSCKSIICMNPMSVTCFCPYKQLI